MTNANLVLTPNEGASLSDSGTAQMDYLGQLGATDVTSTQIDVDGSPALKAEYSLEVDGADGPVTVYGIQYVVFGDDKRWPADSLRRLRQRSRRCGHHGAEPGCRLTP